MESLPLLEDYPSTKVQPSKSYHNQSINRIALPNYKLSKLRSKYILILLLSHLDKPRAYKSLWFQSRSSRLFLTKNYSAFEITYNESKRETLKLQSFSNGKCKLVNKEDKVYECEVSDANFQEAMLLYLQESIIKNTKLLTVDLKLKIYEGVGIDKLMDLLFYLLEINNVVIVKSIQIKLQKRGYWDDSEIWQNGFRSLIQLPKEIYNSVTFKKYSFGHRNQDISQLISSEEPTWQISTLRLIKESSSYFEKDYERVYKFLKQFTIDKLEINMLGKYDDVKLDQFLSNIDYSRISKIYISKIKITRTLFLNNLQRFLSNCQLLSSQEAIPVLYFDSNHKVTILDYLDLFFANLTHADVFFEIEIVKEIIQSKKKYPANELKPIIQSLIVRNACANSDDAERVMRFFKLRYPTLESIQIKVMTSSNSFMFSSLFEITEMEIQSESFSDDAQQIITQTRNATNTLLSSYEEEEKNSSLDSIVNTFKQVRIIQKSNVSKDEDIINMIRVNQNIERLAVQVDFGYPLLVQAFIECISNLKSLRFLKLQVITHTRGPYDVEKAHFCNQILRLNVKLEEMIIVDSFNMDLAHLKDSLIQRIQPITLRFSCFLFNEEDLQEVMEEFTCLNVKKYTEVY